MIVYLSEKVGHLEERNFHLLNEKEELELAMEELQSSKQSLIMKVKELQEIQLELQNSSGIFIVFCMGMSFAKSCQF